MVSCISLVSVGECEICILVRERELERVKEIESMRRRVKEKRVRDNNKREPNDE